MKHKWLVMLGAAMLVAGVAQSAHADLLFDFEGSVQQWSRFGGGTLDFGRAIGEGSHGVGPDGISYVTNIDYTLWGGAVRSGNQSTWGAVPGFAWQPGHTTLADYTSFSADVQLSVDGLDPAYPGPGPSVELMLSLPGYLEFAKSVSLPVDGAYHTISANFADLIPQNAATMPITSAQLANAGLQIRVLLRNNNRTEGDPSGKIRMRVDNVQAYYVPEPVSGLLLAMGGAVVLLRRRG